MVQLIESIEPEIELSIGLHGGAVNLIAGYHERVEAMRLRTTLRRAWNMRTEVSHPNHDDGTGNPVGMKLTFKRDHSVHSRPGTYGSRESISGHGKTVRDTCPSN